MKKTIHKSVLLDEAVENLALSPGQRIVDCTLGGGGHTMAILNKITPNGKVLAIDLDKTALNRFKERISKYSFCKNVILVNDNFDNIKKIVEKNNFNPVDGIVVDFGFSSDQIEDENSGLSFMRDGPLDMRYNKDQELTAESIVNNWPESDLVRIFNDYGEEWMSEKIARAIIVSRDREAIRTTSQLTDVISSVKRRIGKIHPATKVFQALRIAVNDELGVIERFLPQAIDVLNVGGRMSVITFHSLEDRIVKYFFKNIDVNNHACRVGGSEEGRKSRTCDSPKRFNIKLINKKVIKPKWSEVKENRRARSAKLRVIEKVC